MFGPLMRQAGPFRCLPREHMQRVFAAMQPVDVAAGATIVRRGEPGEHYYLIERGWAEIWRSDPMTDETAPVAVLGPGDPFGEEAMLVGGFHTATITMTTDGSLWTLSKPEFDVLVKPVLVEELDAARAHVMASNGEAHWLDCRYDIEFEESRIPGAALAPLDRLREHAGVLIKDQTYIVYCRVDGAVPVLPTCCASAAFVPTRSPAASATGLTPSRAQQLWRNRRHDAQRQDNSDL